MRRTTPTMLFILSVIEAPRTAAAAYFDESQPGILYAWVRLVGVTAAVA